MRLEAEVRIKDQEGAGEKVRRWSAGGGGGVRMVGDEVGI